MLEVWRVSVYNACKSQIRHTNIICNDLILSISITGTNQHKFEKLWEADRQTDRSAITKIETQFYKVRIRKENEFLTAESGWLSFLRDAFCSIPAKKSNKFGGE